MPHVVDLQDYKSTNSKLDKDLLDTVDLVPTQWFTVEPNPQFEASLDADGSSSNIPLIADEPTVQHEENNPIDPVLFTEVISKS